MGTSSLGARPELAANIRMTENRLRRLGSGCRAILAGVLCGGCGGGTTGEVLPPPSRNFVISISSSSTTASQGATSSGIQVSIQALNGFSGDVQVTLERHDFRRDRESAESVSAFRAAAAQRCCVFTVGAQHAAPQLPGHSPRLRFHQLSSA
jgi:hypothetical protein